jgi:hypothetical protein
MGQFNWAFFLEEKYKNCYLGPHVALRPQKTQNTPNFAMQKFRYVGIEL